MHAAHASRREGEGGGGGELLLGSNAPARGQMFMFSSRRQASRHADRTRLSLSEVRSGYASRAREYKPLSMSRLVLCLPVIDPSSHAQAFDGSACPVTVSFLLHCDVNLTSLGGQEEHDISDRLLHNIAQEATWDASARCDAMRVLRCVFCVPRFILKTSHFC